MGDFCAVVLVPMCPPREVWPNARVHWRKKAAAAAQFRAQAGWATRAMLLDHGIDAREHAAFLSARCIVVDVTVSWPKGQRRLDDDNCWASLKAARDGIAAELGVNDRVMRQGDLVQTWGDGSVLVTLRMQEGA